MKTLIVSCSLNPESKSKKLAQQVLNLFSKKATHEIKFLDLSEKELNHVMQSETNDSKQMQTLCEWADNFIFAIPVYNYNVNDAFASFQSQYIPKDRGQMYGLIFAAGGPGSMLVTSIAHQMLMTHNRLHPLPRSLYVSSRDWDQDQPTDDIQQRMQQFTQEFYDLGQKLLR